MADVKITKAMVLAAIKAQAEVMTFDGEVTSEDVIAYCDATLAQLEAKAEKAKERSAAKKAEGDELRARVLACVTEVPQTGDQITAALGDAEVSKPKVTARLTQLVNSGEVLKDQAKFEDGSKKMTYRLA